MGKIKDYRKTGSWRLLVLTLFLAALPAEGVEAEEWLCKAVSVQGTVEVRRAGSSQWEKVRMEDLLFPGDTLRTLPRSRAALLLRNDSIARIDESTTVTLVGLEEEKRSVLDLIRGGGFFFNRAPSSLRILTPYVNAGVEGTEFFLGVEEARATLSVFEGRVAASNDFGELRVRQGQSAVARAGGAPLLATMVRPRDAVQWTLYFPPILHHGPHDLAGSDPGWKQAVRESAEHYRRGDLTGAFARIDGVSETVEDPEFYTYRASLLLNVGRADQAAADLDRALELDSGNSDAHALLAIIAVTRNDKDGALDGARRAVELDPSSSSALIALSYAQQARFDLEGARSSLGKAVHARPGDALAWARLAELELSLGRLGRAMEAARRSVGLDPELAHAQTILGFAFLTRTQIEDARETFQKAIGLAPADPMPRLGLGLALIRGGDLEGGRREIEIAAILDPERSLIRSYLGKAYFDEKRERQASEQYASARELDPLDPTPRFYEALLMQTENRPIEALDELRKSRELNDHRAVFRSRLMLDEDLGVRSAGLARIYRDIGFDRMALAEGWSALNSDPGNYSAHRFLADLYSTQPRQEVARVSELLQSQLLQPINITPLQPRLAESNLFIIEGLGPSDAAFNEYHPLFLRNRAAVQVSGIGGGNATWGEEVVQSTVYNRFSYSLGQFHYQTNGFRDNNDNKEDVYNAFTQVSLAPGTSAQLEIRRNERANGDLFLHFDPDNFSSDFRERDRVTSERLGFHHAFGPQSDLLVSLIHADFQGKTQVSEGPEIALHDRNHSFMGEIQQMARWGRVHLTGGFGHLDANRRSEFTGVFSFADETDIRHTNAYLYSLVHFPEGVVWTLGVSGDFFESDFEKDQLNPKIGVTWNPFPSTTLRAAAFRALKRTLISNQTVEPTQVAGFTQFFGETEAEGTSSWRYGLGADQKITPTLFAGAEISQREMDFPFTVLAGGGTGEEEVEFADWRENVARFYLYWTPHPWLALTGEYLFERFDRPPDTSGLEDIAELKTHRFPLGVGFFHPSGLSARLKATFVKQSGEFPTLAFSFIDGFPVISTMVSQEDDSFWVFDASLSYRLPRRWGEVSLGVKNLFDEGFRFQDTDPAHPTIAPKQVAFVRFTLSY